MKYSTIILAAGSGVRTKLDYNKIFMEINGKRVLDYSVDFFKKNTESNDIILVCSERDFNYVYENYAGRVDSIILGGSTRQQSVWRGLHKAKNEYVVIHDSARPFINKESFDNLMSNVVVSKASTLAVFAKDSMVIANGNRLGKQLDRKKLLSIQTPQAFETNLIKEAHEKALKVAYLATDDTDLVARFTNVTPSFVIGDYRSIKLTTREDIKFLEVIL